MAKQLFSSFKIISHTTSYHFKPYDQNLNSHLLLLFISYRGSGEKLIKISSKFIACDNIHNSHELSVLPSIDITWRNLMLITLRAMPLKLGPTASLLPAALITQDFVPRMNELVAGSIV